MQAGWSLLKNEKEPPWIRDAEFEARHIKQDDARDRQFDAKKKKGAEDFRLPPRVASR